METGSDKMSFEIIDFHTHPFIKKENNICAHKDIINMTAETTLEAMKDLGVSKICGSVIEVGNNEDIPAKLKKNNDEALKLKEQYGDFYIPGFHISPDYVEFSLSEIERMDKKGIKLIGELVPYIDGWQRNFASEEFSLLLKKAGKRNMIVSFHSMNEDAMDEMVKRHRDVIFVAAHPGEYNEFMRHIERMKYSENYYLDVSGYGIFRYGMLKRAVDTFGADRILFGSDYPTCNPAMYIGGVMNDSLLSDAEKEKIFSLNAKKLLKLR